MSMFPTAGSQIYRNEDGEVIGWDNPGYDDPPEYDDDYGVDTNYERPEPEEEEEDEDETAEVREAFRQMLADWNAATPAQRAAAVAAAEAKLKEKIMTYLVEVTFSSPEDDDYTELYGPFREEAKADAFARKIEPRVKDFEEGDGSIALINVRQVKRPLLGTVVADADEFFGGGSQAEFDAEQNMKNWHYNRGAQGL